MPDPNEQQHQQTSEEDVERTCTATSGLNNGTVFGFDSNVGNGTNNTTSSFGTTAGSGTTSIFGANTNTITTSFSAVANGSAGFQSNHVTHATTTAESTTDNGTPPAFSGGIRDTRAASFDSSDGSSDGSVDSISDSISNGNGAGRAVTSSSMFGASSSGDGFDFSSLEINNAPASGSTLNTTTSASDGQQEPQSIITAGFDYNPLGSGSTTANGATSAFDSSEGRQVPQSIITGSARFNSAPSASVSTTDNGAATFGYNASEGQQAPQSNVTEFTGFNFAPSTLTRVGTLAYQYYATTTNQLDYGRSMTMQAISAMPVYENRSFEELRLEDYLAGNRGQGLHATQSNNTEFTPFDFTPARLTRVGTSTCQYHTTTYSDIGQMMTMHAISAMPAYENRSFEELRLEDYLSGNRGQGGQATNNSSNSTSTPQSNITGSNSSNCTSATSVPTSGPSLLDISTEHLEKQIQGKNVTELDEMEQNLIESLQLVKKERERAVQRQLHREENKHVCVICLTEPKNVLLMPCRHLCVCNGCSRQVRTCPVCRKNIQQKVDVYF